MSKKSGLRYLVKLLKAEFPKFQALTEKDLMPKNLTATLTRDIFLTMIMFFIENEYIRTKDGESGHNVVLLRHINYLLELIADTRKTDETRHITLNEILIPNSETIKAMILISNLIITHKKNEQGFRSVRHKVHEQINHYRELCNENYKLIQDKEAFEKVLRSVQQDIDKLDKKQDLNILREQKASLEKNLKDKEDNCQRTEKLKEVVKNLGCIADQKKVAFTNEYYSEMENIPSKNKELQKVLNLFYLQIEVINEKAQKYKETFDKLKDITTMMNNLKLSAEKKHKEKTKLAVELKSLTSELDEQKGKCLKEIEEMNKIIENLRVFLKNIQILGKTILDFSLAQLSDKLAVIIKHCSSIKKMTNEKIFEGTQVYQKILEDLTDVKDYFPGFDLGRSVYDADSKDLE